MPAYPLERNFTYHAPTPNEIRMYGELRQEGRELADLILDTCPDSRERSIALTKLEEAIFWANASIAREGR